MSVTRNLVPRLDNDGQLGTTDKRWAEGHFGTLYADDLSLTSGGYVPVGTVLPYAGTDTSTPPDGYLFCHGGTYNQGDYPALYAVLGNQYGGTAVGGDFGVPDCQGQFLRGHDNGTGADPDAGERFTFASEGVSGDNVGTFEADEYKSHRHDSGWGEVVANPRCGHYGSKNNMGSASTDWDNYRYYTCYSGGLETRPKNMSVSYIIKY